MDDTQRVELAFDDIIQGSSSLDPPHPPGDGATRRIDGGPDATRRVAGEDGTRRVAESDSTQRSEVERVRLRGRLPLGTQAPGTLLCGDCRVLETLHPHESNRPGLFLCDAPEGRVIVKVAASQFAPRPELWGRLPFLQHANVLRIHRTHEVDGFFYEVQEYCTGGTLDDRVPRPGTGRAPATPEWLIDAFVPQLHAALRYLHGQDIIHRDIKPANIYLKPGPGGDTLILGDFDISAVLEQSRTSRDTQRAAGTWLYTAPEAFPRFVDDQAQGRRGRVTRSSDYYSLGITLIELLIGTTSLHLCQLPDLFDFYLQGGRVEIPQGLPGRLTLLLRGLLIRNRQTRWGVDELERWLRGDTTERDLKAVRDDEAFELAHASRPYRLREQVAIDLPSLADAMIREPETAMEDLLSGEVLLNWIGNIDTNVARDIRRDREAWRFTPEVALQCAILRCDATRAFVMPDGHEVTSARDWLARVAQLLARAPGSQDELLSPTMLGRLQSWLALKDDPDPHLAEAIGQITKTPIRARLEELAYLIHPDRPFQLRKGVIARTPKELVALTYGAPEEWKSGRPANYEAAYQRWYDGILHAWLRQRGLAEVAARCEQIRDRLPNDLFAAFETALRQLDPELAPVQVVVDLTAVPRLVTLEHRGQRRLALPYKVVGPGVPFGALTVHKGTSGVRVVEPLIKSREGTAELDFDARQEMPVGRTFTVHLTLESGIAQLDPTPVKVVYQVNFPLSVTLGRVAAGSAIGATLLGGARAVIGTFYPDGGTITLFNGQLRHLWWAIRDGTYPWMEGIIGALVLAVVMYLALRIWLVALERSEV
jgi:serine/threonine protein kinase